MVKKKRITSFIKDNKKKISVIAVMILCLGTYFAVENTHVEETATDDIPLHDGDILVTSDQVTEPQSTNSYFKELRATLDMDRNKIMSMMEEEEKLKLVKYMEQEKTIEALIKNKGLPESFVVVTDTGVNVTVNTEELDQNTVTKICEIIMRQTDRKASEIVVHDAS